MDEARFGDRFELLGVLGRGGMATVHLALDLVRDERVALKVLHPHLAEDPSMRARLRREVQAASRLQHEAALPCHDLHVHEGRIAISLPFHPGRTLAEAVASDGRLDAAAVRTLGVRLAGVLAEAHRKGVLHRDVTPNNVLLQRAEDAVLADFGLARLEDATTATATAALGTPGYAAPERYRGVRGDPRTDLYGLGAVLYFAATGRAPYAGAQALLEQLEEGHVPVAQARPDLPADLAETIEALLRADPARRPESAADVRDALEAEVAAAAPEVPITFELPQETSTTAVVPASGMAPSPAVAPSPAGEGTIRLPRGDHMVVVKRRRRARPQALAEAVGRLGGVVPPPEALAESKFRLVTGVDREVAERLRDAADASGYQAKVYDLAPLTPLERAAELFWLPIPLAWVSYPFLLAQGFPSDVLLPLFVGLSIVLPAIQGAVGRPKPGKELPLALQVEGPVARAPEAAGPAAPSPEAAAAPISPIEGAAAQAERALRALEDALLGSSSLPAAAATDLRATAGRLRGQIAELQRVGRLCEAELAEPPQDLGWARGRLERLGTMARAGEAVDEAEQARLRALVDDHLASSEAQAEVESRLTACLAQLLEIGATARRARRSLAVGAPPETARLLVERLEREVDAVDAARRETGRRLQRAE